MRALLFFFILFISIQNTSAQEYRNLLSRNYSYDTIQKHIVKDQSWVPYPDYKEREKWQKIPQNLREAYIKEGEDYLEYDWKYIPVSHYLEYTKSGSRTIMEKPYRENLKAFETLVLAELMEGKGRFLKNIINGIFYYSEQTYWGNSAHLGLQRVGAGIPDVLEPTIDLGVGKVAANLAWTHHFLEDEINEVNPLILKRLRLEIYEKVLKPYYTRSDFGWMGYTNESVNNWNPWCNYNALNCIMLMEKDSITRGVNVQKSMLSVDEFLNYYKDDGGCEEGPSYWSHAGGKLFDYLELLYNGSNGKIDIYNEELVKNIGSYIYKAYINDEYFVNFADASAKLKSRPGTIYRYGKRMNDTLMSGFGAFLANKQDFGATPFKGKIELALDNLFNVNEIKNAIATEPLIKDFYLKDTEVMGARDFKGNNNGFYFAAKGGHNRESHNHNDVGSFILYYNGEPALIDVGVDTYTAKTFSKDRYSIWTMQSGFHNLPTINGVDQKDGLEFKSKNVTYKTESDNVYYSVDISGAYPKEAKVDKWQRSYTLYRNDKFEIADSYSLSENLGNTQLNFIAALKPKITKPGLLYLGQRKEGLTLQYDPKILKPTIETITIETASRLYPIWGEQIYRIRFKVLSTETVQELKIGVHPVK
ncbi:heparinase II/III family protein [Aurantibacter crassamenti]|uniref:heparinase II/III domain-containing protein n=1 Tax=Aurantibacter crassamenti TaxID=1837375 RepID=UPI00193A7B2F|nr:heparinase II/III family protein [Aurantibacter crassamenti]MBM1107004.1 heparinase II/III family protein [Aurantibacter crassamenti]